MTEIIENIETARLAELNPYPNNAKDHPEEQVKKIADSIEEFGFTVPMVITGENEIIAGHGRYQAVKEHLDLDEVPVIQRDDLTEAQADAFRLADNRITESTWDIEMLGDELNELQYEEIDLELTGFNDDELDAFDVSVSDPAPDAREEFEESGLPEYENEDLTPEFSFKINFASKADLEDFSELVESTVTVDTTSIWYPKQEKRNVEDTAWEDES
jgi:ParB-like chromosome segregation protein Spo0J